MHPTANALLELHVQHELTRLTKDTFLRDMAEFVTDLFQLSETLTLNETMTPAQIMGVIKRTVIELDVHGGIIELVGEAIPKVRAYTMQRNIVVSDLLDRHSYDEYINKVFDLFEERGELIKPILTTPLYTRVISDLVLAVLNQYFSVIHKRGLTLPFLGDLLHSGEKFFTHLTPELNNRIEENIKIFTTKNIQWLVTKSLSVILEAFANPELRENLLSDWDDISQLSVTEFDETIQALDLNEFVVIGFEHWKRFRTTNFFYGCCETVVQYLFDKYGDEPLAILVGDMGIGEALVVREIQELAPRAVEALKSSGFMEAQLRKRLNRFYESETVSNLFD